MLAFPPFVLFSPGKRNCVRASQSILVPVEIKVKDRLGIFLSLSFVAGEFQSLISIGESVCASRAVPQLVLIRVGGPPQPRELPNFSTSPLSLSLFLGQKYFLRP